MGGRVVGEGSQAIALSAQASSGYYGCSFYGFQDTVLANKGTQYYRNCDIKGAIDFIFGSGDAVAWFEKCDIRVRKGGRYITGECILSSYPPWTSPVSHGSGCKKSGGDGDGHDEGP